MTRKYDDDATAERIDELNLEIEECLENGDLDTADALGYELQITSGGDQSWLPIMRAMERDTRRRSRRIANRIGH